MNEAAKAWLERNQTAKTNVDIQQRELEVIRGMARTVRSLNGSPIQAAELTRKLERMEQELLEAIGQSFDIFRECRSGIEAVQNPTYRALLELRYLSSQSWEQIAEAMNYDNRYIYKLHNHALDAIAKHIPPEWADPGKRVEA